MPVIPKQRQELAEHHRSKIKISQIVNRLQDHVFGKCKMSSTQIMAANVLLKKVMPDLKAVEVSGNVDLQVTKITEELINPSGD
jgi:hypothetical protein